MIEVYTACLVFGVLFTVVTVLLGDVLSSALHGALDVLSPEFLNPTGLAVGVTVFGGTGFLWERYGPDTVFIGLLAALVVGILAAWLTGRFLLKPIRKAENSTGYGMQSLVGRIGEVLTPLPEGKGVGEVLVKIGAGYTNQIAASVDGQPIEAGARVVVVQVKDGVVHVSRFDA